MLRPYLHRIVLTGVLMAGLVGTGLLFGNTIESAVDPVLPGPAIGLVIQQSTTAGLDDETPARANSAREQLSWPFFSFGRTGKRASW